MTMPKIDSTSFLPARHADAYAKGRAAQPSTAATEGSPVGPQGPPDDRAEISAGARSLVDLRAAVDAGRAALAEDSGSRPERVAAARTRLASGYYGTEAVRLATADRLRGVLDQLDTL
jgi:hypothetical protein